MRLPSEAQRAGGAFAPGAEIRDLFPSHRGDEPSGSCVLGTSRFPPGAARPQLRSPRPAPASPPRGGGKSPDCAAGADGAGLLFSPQIPSLGTRSAPMTATCSGSDGHVTPRVAAALGSRVGFGHSDGTRVCDEPEPTQAGCLGHRHGRPVCRGCSAKQPLCVTLTTKRASQRNVDCPSGGPF